LQKDDDFIDYRLPTSVKPISYTIRLENSWVGDPFIFNGTTIIQAKVINATDNITLHVGNLQIITDTVTVNKTTIVIKDRIYDNVTEKYTFKLSKILDNDTIVDISFNYVGNLSDNMAGFYRSSYVDEKGQIK
jgi:aminopeptidase 2